MAEQLSYELYKWLSSMDVIPPTLRYRPNGNYELDKKTAEGLLNGSLIARLLSFLAQQFDAVINGPLLSSIKNSSTPAARMYNWNILAESFTKINVTITKSTIKEITSGNFNSLQRFLLEVHKKYHPKKVERKQQHSGSADINLKKLQVLQSYDEAENLLELIILILSDKLNLTPKQAVSTLNENAKYYSHMVVKGVKNSFEQILALLETLDQQLPKIMFKAEKDPQKNTQFLLSLIKPTLISRQSDVAKRGAHLFAHFVDESLKYNSKNIVYQILCKESQGFDFFYMALKRHPDLVSDFTKFLFPLVQHAMKDFFQVYLKKTINNQQQYLKILLRLIEGISSNSEGKEALEESGLLTVWLQGCQTSFVSKLSKEEDLVNQQNKILYLELLCVLWKEYATKIDQQYAQQMLVKGINELKKNSRRNIYTVKVPALLRLFDFLQFLAQEKNRMAAVVYKKLIFLLIQNHDETEVRQLILNNFNFVLQQNPTIPIEFLLEPLLRQLQTSEGKSYVLNIFDFQFFIEICKHPRMDPAFALSYLEYFSRLYIKSFIYAKMTIRVISVLTSRFCEQEAIIQFVKKNIDNTLNQYSLLTFNKKKASRQDKIANKQRQSLSIELIKHFIQLEHQQLRAYILTKVTGLYLLWLDTKNHQNKGLRYLIALFGDVQQLCIQYKVQQNTFLQSEMPAQSQQLLPQMDSFTKPTPKSEAYYEMEYMKQQGIGYKDKSKPHRTHKTNADSRLELSAVKPNPRALEQLERIKEKLRDGQTRKKQEQVHQLQRIKQRKSINSLELMQRNLSLGYTKLTPQLDDQIIFEFNTVKQKQLKMTPHFHALDQLESVDAESANTILKNYAKDIKAIFLKYALMSSNSDYARRAEPAGVMSFADVIKLLNQKGVGVFNKLIVSDLLSSINYSKRKEKNILYGIEESDFNEFLLKLTDYLIQNEPSAPQLPFGLRLQKLIKTLLRNQPFYENRFRAKEDPKIGQLRQALRQGDDIEMEIPEGYRKVKETQVHLQYQIPETPSGVDEHFRIGYELTDWLLYKCIGIHVVTPIIKIQQAHNIIQVPKAIRISKPQTSKKLQPSDVPGGSPTFETKKRRERPDKRSQSQKSIKKTKIASVSSVEEDKVKAAKRQKYLQQMKQNLERLKQDKMKKEEEERRRQAEKQEEQRRKEQKRKQYMESNRQKIKQRKLKEEESQKQKQEAQRISKERALEDRKKREKELLSKHQQQIEKFANKGNDKKKGVDHAKSKPKIVPLKQSNIPDDTEKTKMLEVKNSLQSGALSQLTSEYGKQLTQIFQAYWIWEQKRIDLNSMALIFKDFKISPEYILPKTLAETYKSISKGQPLDYDGFQQCIAKCSYKSPKLMKEGDGEGQTIEPKVLKLLFQKLRMNEHNYKQIVKNVKNHIE